MVRNALTLGSLLCAALITACQARTEEPVTGPQQQPPAAAAPTPSPTPAPAAIGMKANVLNKLFSESDDDLE